MAEKAGDTPHQWQQGILMELLKGAASSFRWMLASLLAVHGGALVALMQAGVDRKLVKAGGWLFVAGLSATLLAGLVCFWGMVLLTLIAGDDGSDASEKEVVKAVVVLCISTLLLVASFALSILGFVAIQIAIVR